MSNKLALFGGKPLVKDHKRLRLDWPIVDKSDYGAIKKAFDDRDFSGRGSKRISDLEYIFSKYYDGLYATALNSGTAALHLALISLGIKPGDEVIVPALTFVATAMSVIHNNSIPVFADIDRKNFNILPSSIEKNISKRTKAVIVVHLHGAPADMDPIIKICRKYKLKLIEDVAQAPGATYKGRKIGTFGDAAIFSLMSQKNLATCGECGILLNKSKNDKNRAEMARIYGEIVKSNTERIYNSYTLGWNYTLNPIQAAMAISQLKKFNKITNEIQYRARKLNNALNKFGWILPPVESEGTESVFHFYRFQLNSNYFDYKCVGRFRQAVQDALNAEGLNVRHYQKIPLAGQPFFQKNDINKELPWSLNSNSYIYNINDYPNTLEVINSTLILGAISSAPGYLLCPGTIEKYLLGFEKIDKNIHKLLSYADGIKYSEPWEEMKVISDSFGAKYGVFSSGG
ncbi:MAG: hypothetical protein A2406_04140 [Candidatus Komeilibacteria bacterium RIFOXYC1_FULL_37_11]|uniref:Glutamine--scyllo-inositol aminotransferase n=1 Tax=Candidatus Komeilibacteria bacterium RIFOXYC1_FULL_37_11 TaxID=1798555 RepID=A0A1G2BYY4_9BACT|nr:MAG: hypothetical protein A2406_04140 [Candidatus Komeilibacteria bacterium RIFOXYC1_FULL_37_11]OGY95896.1 MAG: hypothetical protein A2611_03580 [Candidatus Komeilibacteria bacterium RIFOXYD1_FULL_37_29]